MSNTYDQGETTDIYASQPFTDLTGVARNPTTMEIVVLKPDGTYIRKTYGTDPEVTLLATGQPHMTVLLDVPGIWTYRILGTGQYAGSSKNTLTVSRDPLI